MTRVSKPEPFDCREKQRVTRNAPAPAAGLCILLRTCTTCFLVLAPCTTWSAVPYPARPVRLIIHGNPGSSPDIIARTIAERLAVVLGQPVVADNRPGATGTIALAAVAKSVPDGHTLGTFTMSHALAPNLMKTPYDTHRDLAPLRQTTQASMLIVVRADSPQRSLADLVAAAKGRPGRLNYASSGTGAPTHLAGETFKLRAGVDILHVPYKGGPAALTALLGEQVDALSTTSPTVGALLRGGKLRALATTGPVRMAGFPDVPTLAESGFPGFDVRDWQGLVVPAMTPKPVVERLAAEISKVLALKEVRERIDALGMEPVAESGPDAFGKWIRSEMARWAKFVKETGMRLE